MRNHSRSFGLFRVILSVAVALVFVIGTFPLGFSRADGSVNVNTPSHYNEDQGQVTGTTSGYSSGQTVRFTLNFSCSEVYVGSSWGVTVISGEGSSSLVLETANYGPNLSWGLNVSGTNIGDFTCSASGVTVTGGDPVTPAPTQTTPAPTQTTPRPTTPAPTQTTPRPTTPAPTQTTPRPTTPAPTQATPAPTQATPAPSVAQPTETAPNAASSTFAAVPSESANATTTPTPTATPTPTPTAESSESEETAEVSDTEVVAPVVSPSEEATPSDTYEETEAGTPTPTPHVNPTVAATHGTLNNDKGGFPWWIVILLALAGVGGYRYNQLRKEGKDNKDILYDFIPGGIVGTVIEKIHPSPVTTTTTPAPDVDANGYLKKSNTAAIRPVYSNAPTAKPGTTRGVNTTPVGTTKTRPASSTAATTSTATKTTATGASASATKTAPANKVPVQQRPPIKRPSNLSVNHAQTQAAKTAGTASSATAASAKETKPASTQAVKRPTGAHVSEATPATTTAKPRTTTLKFTESPAPAPKKESPFKALKDASNDQE